MKKTHALDDLWINSPDVIRKFIELRPKYEKLSEEVAYILEKAVKAAALEYSAITWRAKTIESFCEKVLRKNYSDPLDDITDFAGVRIVYLYNSDRTKFQTSIEREFEIITKINKIDRSLPDRFGYGALHYLVRLKKKLTGARYDELKNLICEIQVRTILQDAWAIVAHHLNYKKESDVPMELRRKLNALSGLFETADDQFDRLREERTNYIEKVKEEIKKQADIYLESEMNLDNISEFLKWRLPNRERSPIEDEAGLLAQLQKYEYKTLGELDDILSRAEEAIKAYETKYPPLDEETGEHVLYTSTGAVRVAFEFIDKSYQDKVLGKGRKGKIEEFIHLVKNHHEAEQAAPQRRGKPRG